MAKRKARTEMTPSEFAAHLRRVLPPEVIEEMERRGQRFLEEHFPGEFPNPSPTVH